MRTKVSHAHLHLNSLRANICCAGSPPLTGSPFRIPERVFIHAGIDGRLHILRRPVELYALVATGKRVDYSNQRGDYCLYVRSRCAPQHLRQKELSPQEVAGAWQVFRISPYRFIIKRWSSLSSGFSPGSRETGRGLCVGV